MKAIFLFLLVVIAVAITALYFGQRKMIFPAPSEPLPATLDADIEVISLAQGRALLAPSLKPSQPSPLIVYAHGNAALAHWSLDDFRYLREVGFTVLLLEYPGYAGTNGRPTANSLETAAIMAINSVVTRDSIDSSRVVAYGRSIGSGVACRIAMKTKISALVLESPFASLSSLVSEKGYPSFMLRDRFDNDEIISATNVPIFIYHGTKDRLIPIEHSERLASLAKNSTFHKEECGHNDCPRPWPELMAFFRANDLID